MRSTDAQGRSPMMLDPILQTVLRSDDLVREAERARLAAQLPHSQSRVRHELAIACYRLAGWLDDENDDDHGDEYLPPIGSGRSDLVARSASV
jgi:hypothetical protein